MELDFSVIDKLGLSLPPIGVNYDLFKPEGVPPLEFGLDKSLCEILRYAQEKDEPFYFSKEHPENCVGKIMVGMDSFPPSAEAGEIGPRLGVFNAARCNARLYYSVKRLPCGSVNYVSFLPYRHLHRVPDVLIFTGPAAKLEPVMRAAAYSTGEGYHSECTPVMGCSWFMVYPYMTGKINFVVPAFVHGPHGRQLWGSDTVVVAVPYQWIPTVLGNLAEMPLELPGHANKEAYYSEFGGILADLAKKMENP